MPYGFKLPGTDIVKVPNSGGGSDPTKLPLAGGTLSGLLNFSGTTHAGIRLNSLTTTQRNALTAGAGDFLLNTTLNQLQGYVSGAWVSLATLGANTFTSAQTFDATTGAIFPGSTSGNATVKAPAIAGTSVITLPGVTSTLATLGANVFTDAQRISSGFLIFGTGSGVGVSIGKASASQSFSFFNETINNYVPIYALDVGVYDTGAVRWSNTSDSSSFDTFLYRATAATVQMGANAAPVTNQHFKACNRITSNGVGANLTLSGGNGRGGAGGDLILASYTTAGSGVAGTLTPRWRIDAATGKLLPEANATYDLGGDTLNLSSVWSSAFYVGSDQVVGPRGAAVADAATGAATASFGDVNTALDGIATQLNDLLARVRIHGLIAP